MTSWCGPTPTCPYPNHQIPQLVDALGDADQVVGARTSEEGTLKFFRVPAKWLIRRLAQYLTQTKIPDLNSGFRAFRRDVALQYTHQLPPGFSCVTTITMAFLMNGYRVEFVPIDYETRAGESKFHWWKDTRRYALQVIRMMLSYDPLRVMLPIASLLGLIFVGKLGYDLVDKDFRPAANYCAARLRRAPDARRRSACRPHRPGQPADAVVAALGSSRTQLTRPRMLSHRVRTASQENIDST